MKTTTIHKINKIEGLCQINPLNDRDYYFFTKDNVRKVNVNEVSVSFNGYWEDTITINSFDKSTMVSEKISKFIEKYSKETYDEEVNIELRKRFDREIIESIEEESYNFGKTLSFEFISGGCVFLRTNNNNLEICSYGTNRLRKMEDFKKIKPIEIIKSISKEEESKSVNEWDEEKKSEYVSEIYSKFGAGHAMTMMNFIK